MQQDVGARRARPDPPAGRSARESTAENGEQGVVRRWRFRGGGRGGGRWRFTYIHVFSVFLLSTVYSPRQSASSTSASASRSAGFGAAVAQWSRKRGRKRSMKTETAIWVVALSIPQMLARG